MLCFRCGSYNIDAATTCTVCGQELAESRGKRAKAAKQPEKSPQSIFDVGDVVAGRYRIQSVLGQGGVGVVFKARDTQIDVDIALKAIAPNLLQTDEEQRLFSRMMRQARKLQHPNIVRLYDEGAEENRRWFTMKLLEGLTLRKIIRLRHDKGQSFTPEEIVPIFHQLASAFDYAHKTTWHGDLKPENVIILPDLLKVTDFNLVKGLPLKPFLGIAKSRSKGFPYIAPELRVESTQVDGRADIYSMGVILAEMLTGLVYEGHFTRAMTAALEQLPTKLDGLVRRALSEHPDGRFPKAGDMARELEAALEKLGPGALPPPAGKTPKKRRPPPPPPEETNPRAVQKEPTSEESVEDASLEEIGQSQVLLLDDDGPPTLSNEPPTLDGGAIAPAARRRREERAEEVISGMTPPPLADAHDDDDDDLEPGALSRRPPLPDDALVEATIEDGDRPLVPPPLPENADLDASDSYDVPEGVSVRGIGARKQGKSPRSLRDDGEEEETMPDLAEVGIHEELTALKPHPRPEPVSVPDAPAAGPPDLPDDVDEDEDPSDVETVTRGVAAVRPPSSEESSEEEPPDLASPAEIAHAKERSSPRLHAAEPVAPPVVAPGQSGAHGGLENVPPGLRPVAPPTRKKSPAPLYIAAAAVVVVAVVAVLALRGGGGDEGAQTTYATVHGAPGATPEEGAGEAKAPPTGEGGEIATPTPGEQAGEEAMPDDEEAVAAALEAQRAKEQAEELARQEEDRRRQEEEERRRQEEEERRRAEAERARTEDKRTGSDDAAARREAERVAALARERAEADERRRLEQERRREEQRRAEEKKKQEEAARVAAIAKDPSKAKCPAGMVLIPAGSFTMGSSPSDPMRNFGENLATRTDVATYCIDYYEFPNSSSRPPTTGVTWAQAKSACERKGRRLCTEAEWERACKGPGNARFAYGNNYDADKCNTEDPSGKPRELQGARAFRQCRSGFGLFAMSGNAEEWVADNFRAGASSKVAKGGAADRPDWASRCAARRGLAPTTKRATLGFRCCANPE